MKINRRGFSLIEAMIVLVIFGVLVIVGVPIMTSAMAEYRLNNATQIISTAIQRARYMAAAGNRQYVVRISNSAPYHIEVFLDANWNLTYDAPDQTEAANLQAANNQIIGYTDLPIPDSVSIVSGSVDFGIYPDGQNRILVFSADGTVWMPENTTPLYVQPAPDPWNSATKTPKLQLHTEYWGQTGNRWIGISKFGEVTAH